MNNNKARNKLALLFDIVQNSGECIGERGLWTLTPKYVISNDLRLSLAKGVTNRKPSLKVGGLDSLLSPFGQHKYNEPAGEDIDFYLQPASRQTSTPDTTLRASYKKFSANKHDTFLSCLNKSISIILYREKVYPFVIELVYCILSGLFTNWKP